MLNSNSFVRKVALLSVSVGLKDSLFIFLMHSPVRIGF